MKNNPKKISLRERRKKARKKDVWRCSFRFLCLCVFAAGVIGIISNGIKWCQQNENQEKLQKQRQKAMTGAANDVVGRPEILQEYKELYEQNKDIIGWLFIEGTTIDYPVMQTPEDEGYYLDKDFYGEKNDNGCLIMDTDSVVGSGTASEAYENGVSPSDNLIIHGHTRKDGQMFGNLQLYSDEEYGMTHNIICFDSLYEKRKYELIAVFYSQVYYEKQRVFKYYKFFQADTQEEFEDWYRNIKQLSLYDTGVSAEFGDEFLTLSCCSYHVEDGRFVVVAKRTD